MLMMLISGISGLRDLGPECIQPVTLAQFAVKRDVQHHPNYTPNG
jgi:hypothetical protein